ncbi:MULTISPECIES: helix-turn-helix domain-containing protein [Brevibacterium]|uniref:helix-turn-helix domain-containing protein n=1 Tax=Brevibacterium TaxID=1696 RepID=UPI0031D310CA
MGRFDSDDARDLIRTARLDAGLTQAELAERAGMRQPTIAQIESGTRKISPETLERILQAADYRPALALERVVSQVRDIAAELGLRNVRVFGSVARNEDGYDSDIDLIVSADDGVDLFDLAYFGEQVRQITGFPVDVIVDNGPVPPGWDVLREAVPV